MPVGSMLDARSCYQAVLARDARFDGVFFVGVSSTGIYCRPVCPARTPARARCRFFRSAAEAEAQGFRACLRCRPERAPGQAPMDAAAALGVQAWRRIEAGALDGGSVEALSRGLGVTSRHLRRVVESVCGASPLALAQSYRLARARALVQDTRLSLVDVAHASGFRSLRRFQAAFRERFDAAPGELRRGPRRSASTSARLDYRPPLAWEALLDFLAARAVAGVEAVDGDGYRRTALLGRHAGWLSVRPLPGRTALELTVSEGLVPVLPEVASRVRRLFDLDARPDVVDRALAVDSRLAPLVRARPGLRVPGAFDGFELAVAALLGAPARAAALASALGPVIGGAPEPLHRAFPPAPLLAAAGELPGVPVGRARALRRLARAVARGALSLEPGAPPAPLLDLPGVGRAQAQRLALHALRWPDAFPSSDRVLRRALGAGLRQAAETWRPWRGYAAVHLWTAALQEERGP